MIREEIREEALKLSDDFECQDCDKECRDDGDCDHCNLGAGIVELAIRVHNEAIEAAACSVDNPSNWPNEILPMSADDHEHFEKYQALADNIRSFALPTSGSAEAKDEKR